MNSPSVEATDDKQAQQWRSIWQLVGRFFRSKPKVELPKKKEPARPEWLARWDKIHEAYPVGRRLEYLGRVMVVTKHCHYFTGIYGPWSCCIPTEWPGLVAEYVDDHGQIRAHKFDQHAWPILANIPVSNAGANTET